MQHDRHLVYLFDEADAAKHAVARGLVEEALINGTGVISFQLVQETLNVLTRKLKVIARAEDATSFMQYTLLPLWRVQPSLALYAAALDIQQRQRFGFDDSLVVAAALEAGCRRLLSEDLQHGQRIGALRVENPFRV